MSLSESLQEDPASCDCSDYELLDPALWSLGKVHATNAFFPTKKKWNIEGLLYWEGPKGSCLVSVPLTFSLILLSPEENRDGTGKGI